MAQQRATGGTSNRGSDTSGSDFEQRITRLEAEVGHRATKEDIQRLKVWILGGALTGIISLVVVLVRVFWNPA